MPPQSSPPPQMNNSQIMGILAYLGPLVIVSYLMGKDDPFVKFHIKQGLVLFAIEVVVWVLSGMFFFGFWQLLQLINLATLILSIMGIVHVVRHEQKEVPIVGGLANNFNI